MILILGNQLSLLRLFPVKREEKEEEEHHPPFKIKAGINFSNKKNLRNSSHSITRVLKDLAILINDSLWNRIHIHFRCKSMRVI